MTLKLLGEFLRREQIRAKRNELGDWARDRLRYALAHSPDLAVADRFQLEESLKMKRRKRPPAAVVEDKVLSGEEVDRFIRMCPDKTVALIFEFLYFTACRVSEALGIPDETWQQVRSIQGVRLLG